MGLRNFTIQDTNPNSFVGPGGCVCSEYGCECQGPYTVFWAVQTDNPVSPHVVIGADCLRAAAAELSHPTPAPVVDTTAEVDSEGEEDLPEV